MTQAFQGHLREVIHFLEQDQPLAGLPGGLWTKCGRVTVILQNLFNVGDTRIVSLGKAFCKAMDNLEKSSVITGDSDWINLGNCLIEKLQMVQIPAARRIESLVGQRIIGFQYRENFPSSSSFSFREMGPLMEKAIRWKRRQTRLDVTKWLPKDSHILHNVAKHYPDFAYLIDSDDQIRSQFFDWIIRDRMDAGAFVEFPKTQELLQKIKLAPSVHVAKKPKLKIKTRGGMKYLTFPLYARHGEVVKSKSVRLLDKDREYILPGGNKTRLRQIYKELKRKNNEWVNYLITENGFENWNVKEWGTFNAAGQIVQSSLPPDRWFYNVPVLERLTLKKAKARYGETIDGSNYGVMLRASRRQLNFDVIGSHSYFELCIPDKKGGYFALCLGKFPSRLPLSFWEMIKILGDTVDGVVVSHDLNRVKPWRQQTRFSVVVETPEFLWFAEKMRKAIVDGLLGNSAFSLFADSCSVWSQNMMNDFLKQLPEDHPYKLTAEEELNFFIMKVHETEPRGLLKWLQKLVQLFPEFVQRFLTHLILMFFLPWRGKWVNDEDGTRRWVSCYRCRSWNHLQIHNPAKLFDQQINEKKFLPVGRQPDWLLK